VSDCVREPELEAALDKRLDAGATREVFAHARGCLRCRAARAELERLRALAAAMPAPAPDALRARRLRASLMGAALMGDAPRRARPAALLAAAACLSLLAGAGAWAQRRGRGASPRSVVVVTTTAADARRVELGGAGTLWPAADARVLVRSAGRDTRIELWQGAITVQVNPRRAGERFVVQLSDAEVEVHGTRFVVAAEAGRLARVDVVEGVVAVRHAGDPERFLAAGAHLIAAQAPEAPPPVEAAPEPVAPPVAPARAQPTTDPGVWFREASLAYMRGDHATADRALGRFLAATPRGDARREDARYLPVLSLHALGRVDALVREADAYARELPGAVRRPEVVLAVATALVDNGRCDEAAVAGRAMPESAPARLRSALARALSHEGRGRGCRSAPGASDAREP
jgi:ferric-dicitrate binding protein FerR (iron transport regulator)